jgi:hypothetical protein
MNSYQIFKIKIKNKNLFQGLSNATTLIQIQSGRTVPKNMMLRFPMTVDVLFHRYASTVLEIHKMNEELNSQLRDIAEFTAQLGSEEGELVFYQCCGSMRF